MNKQVATIGGGCFWCLEAVMQQLRGVSAVDPGYAGGVGDNPQYREVCSGETGHAEVIQVCFDADQISYHDLLTVFMTSHDPTTLDRQGADRGTQYRSTIMYRNEEQKQIAKQVLLAMSDSFSDRVVTEVVPLKKFFPAEAYHRNYYTKNASQGYCRVVIEPKLAKLRAEHAERLVLETV